MDWKRFVKSTEKKPREKSLSDRSIFDFRFPGLDSLKPKPNKPKEPSSSQVTTHEGILRGFHGRPKSLTCWLFVDDGISITPVAAHDYDFVARLKGHEGEKVRYTRDFRTKELLTIKVIDGSPDQM